MNISLWLERTAQIYPLRPALFLGRECVANYGDFHRQAAQVAAWMVGKGVRPGDRVALFMNNCPEYLIALYGVWFAGAVVVPINAKLHGREAAWIIENAEAKLALVTDQLRRDLKAAQVGCDVVDVKAQDFGVDVVPPVSRSADDLAWLFYTSGTTGRPKGVMITHQMLIAMSLSYLADADTISHEDAALYAAPLSHGAGIYNMMHVLAGARHVCPVSGGFDAVEIFDLAGHFGRVHMFAAPTMVKRMTGIAKATGADGAGLRTIVYAGGPMYLADIIEAVDHFGPIFVQIYGQGECPMSITALSRQDVADRGHPRWRERLGSVGRAQSVVEVRIGDADGQEVACGTAGEIMVRGATVMPGYWQNAAATSKTIVDGWLLTGDVGFMDADGYVTMQDRSKDMIISGGSNIYPREVEEVLLMFGDVAEVSVVGRPHPEWGEDVVAFVVLRAGAVLDRAALDAHCLAHIARFKRPKEYVVLGELPKNNYGKVLKTDLRAMLEATK